MESEKLAEKRIYPECPEKQLSMHTLYSNLRIFKLNFCCFI